MLSIVIPTLNDAHRIDMTLASLEEADLDCEIVISDGGSTDGTAELATRRGIKVTRALRGRGVQLSAGAEASVGNWVLFLHADTQPGPGWTTVVKRFIANPDNRFHAAYFGFALDDSSPAAERLEKMVAWRCRTFGLPYGDQGFLISRDFYDQLGGYKNIPIMEDVELVTKIKNHRLVQLPVNAVTSAEKFKRDGYFMRSARNLFCLALYFAGLPPSYITALYR
jgi:rSAM/selenodomain-associated transferase 2